MIAGTEGRHSAGTHLAFIDVPGKSRTYVRRVDVPWHSWTADPRDAHRFVDKAAAAALLAEWVPNAGDFAGTIEAAAAVRAHNRVLQAAKAAGRPLGSRAGR